jgi:transposase
VDVGNSERAELEAWLGSQTGSRALAMRARIILGSADGESIRELAERLEVSEVTVCRWRNRYRAQGLAGLRTRTRSGRRRRISPADERRVVAATMRAPAATHWSTRRLAKEVRLSPATVHRIWQKYGLQPHRLEHLKFSIDPEFETKLADIVGLYLDPPERALVLCVDEKAQIQALNRMAPLLPLRPGLPAQMTHDYQRHGTSACSRRWKWPAAGWVHGRCYRQHRHHEFVTFLDSLARRYRTREINFICDNYGTHKHPAVKQWLAEHPRFHLHFTPTSGSWLNLVERWFALISQQAIRRGSFKREVHQGALRFLGPNHNRRCTAITLYASTHRLERRAGMAVGNVSHPRIS